MTDAEIRDLMRQRDHGELTDAEFSSALWNAGVSIRRYAGIEARKTLCFLVKMAAVTFAVILLYWAVTGYLWVALDK